VVRGRCNFGTLGGDHLNHLEGGRLWDDLVRGRYPIHPGRVIEGAKIDGASYWQRVAKIILPLNYRIILLVTLTSVIGSMLAFEQFYIMTTGAPENETITSAYWIYTNSFTYFKLGYGSTLSIILMIIIVAATAIQIALTRRRSME
jgi:multiple sugar transport system permease protein